MPAGVTVRPHQSLRNLIDGHTKGWTAITVAGWTEDSRADVAEIEQLLHRIQQVSPTSVTGAFNRTPGESRDRFQLEMVNQTERAITASKEGIQVGEVRCPRHRYREK